MTLKLSRAAIARDPALTAIDKHFAKLIAAEIGPLGALHALKRAQAEAGVGALVADDRDAVLVRAAEQDARLAEIDQVRLSLKRRVRAASAAAEITAILAELS